MRNDGSRERQDFVGDLFRAVHMSLNFLANVRALAPRGERRPQHNKSMKTPKKSNKKRGAVDQPRLVCAQHGRDVNGVQVPCRKTRHENEETTI
jgi:hypothetical protein